MLNDSLRLSRDLGDALGEALSLAHLGRCMIASGRPAQARPYLDAALPNLRTAPDVAAFALALLYLGLATHFTGKSREACEHFAQAARLCRQIGFRSLEAHALQLLAIARIELGDLSGAHDALAEALPTSVELEDGWVIPQEICGFASLAARRGKPRQALELAGFADAYSRAHDFSVPPIMRAAFERWLAPARQSLASAARRYVELGEQMQLAEAVVCALADEPEDAPPGRLTARELQVADCVARGLTNREIASQLTLSVRTVEVHVDHILTKLDLHSRTQLAAWVYDARLPQDT